VLSGRGLGDGLITRPEESYRLWCVSNVCDQETSTERGGPGTYRAVEPLGKKEISVFFRRSNGLLKDVRTSIVNVETLKNNYICCIYWLRKGQRTISIQ
jgi:hypothetical protein